MLCCYVDRILQLAHFIGYILYLPQVVFQHNLRTFVLIYSAWMAAIVCGGALVVGRNNARGELPGDSLDCQVHPSLVIPRSGEALLGELEELTKSSSLSSTP